MHNHKKASSRVRKWTVTRFSIATSLAKSAWRPVYTYTKRKNFDFPRTFWKVCTDYRNVLWKQTVGFHTVLWCYTTKKPLWAWGGGTCLCLKLGFKKLSANPANHCLLDAHWTSILRLIPGREVKSQCIGHSCSAIQADPYKQNCILIPDSSVLEHICKNTELLPP